jgi:hypothetical protein
MRIRLLRAARGLSLLVLILSLLIGGAFLCDSLQELSPEVLAVLLGLMSATAAGLVLFGILVPACRRLDAPSLAALIEEEYPELGERLTSTVELASSREAIHGSAELIELLLEDTEGRARRLDFTRAFPARSTRYLAIAAAAALVALLPSFLFLQDQAADFGRRLLYAWFPSDTMQPETIRPPEPVPQTVPVELAAQSPSITITPPRYVNRQVHPVKKVVGIADLSGLEYSAVRFDFAFTRPAQAARLEILGGMAGSVFLPLTLAEDRLQGSLELPTLPAGKHELKLHLEAERHLVNVVELRTLSIWTDEPPVFTQVPKWALAAAGAAEARWTVQADALGNSFSPVRSLTPTGQIKSATPDDALGIKAAVEDKVGVGRIELEYRVNEGPSRFETLANAGGTRTAAAEVFFQLSSKVKDGDMLYYRLRAADNRHVAQGAFAGPQGQRIPSTALDPQKIYFPTREKDQDRWFVLRIDRQATPLAEQELIGQRDQFRQQLERVRHHVTQERENLQKIRRETGKQPQLTAEQRARLEAVQEQNRDVRGELKALAREAAEDPSTRPLADQAEDIAQSEMQRSDEALTQGRDPKAAETARDQQLQKADQQLAAAQKRLEKLARQNDQLAQDRLDQMKMERLARREEALAKKTGELAAPTPAKAREVDEVKAEQARVAEELNRLANQSRRFQEAMQAVRGEQAEQLAEQARKLAQAQRDLNDAEKQAFKQAHEARLADLARKQQNLAEKAKKLARETNSSTKLLGTPPLQANAVQQAADALRQADLGETLKHQERALRNLEQVARALDKTTELPRDPREAAKKLAKMEDLLIKKLAQIVKDHDPAKPLEESLEPLIKEQRGIQEAVEKLDLPSGNEAAQSARKKAVELSKRAADTLKSATPSDAPEAMGAARDALQRLANSLPAQQKAPTNPQQAAAKETRTKLPGSAQSRQARELAQAQQELHQAVQKLAKSNSPPNMTARQQAQQKDLQQQTGKLTQEFRKLAQEPPGGRAQQQSQHAAQAAQQAEQAMQQALNQAQAGNQGKVQQAGAQAAQKLEEAARAAQQVAGKHAESSSEMARAGEAVQQGKQEAAEAQKQLGQGKPQAAQAAMQKAAQAMQQAAQAFERTDKAGQPHEDSRISGLKGAAPGGVPDPRLLGPDGKKYAGRPWGELPGELRTRVLQDMRARYGEDYARIIQRYFEQIADTRKQTP